MTTTLLEQRGFGRFWAADAVSMFGTYVTTLALQVLATITLAATPVELGLLNSARWLPYLLIGLFVGVVVDRYRRRPVLVAADLIRAVLLGVVPLLAVLDALRIETLIGLVFVFGAISLVYDAAHQSYLPRLVPTALLTRANARLEQTNAIAQSTGPLLAGALVKAFSAPFAILVDAASYLFSGLVLASVRVEEPTPKAEQRHFRREFREGLSWVYRHPMLAPYALSSHARFLFSSIFSTVFVLFVLRDIGLGAFGLGVLFAFTGLGAVIGNGLSERVDRRLGAGRTVILGRVLVPLGLVLAPFAAGGGWSAWLLLGASQFMFGFGLGVEGPVDMGYRQAITPDALQGRMNSTIRSMNWGLVSVGAIVGGVLAQAYGDVPTLWVAIAGQAVAVAVLSRTRYRLAVMPDDSHSP